MEFAKFTGKTLDEALNVACSAKGCAKEELHYEVTEEKSGFLGIGKTIEIEAYCQKDIEGTQATNESENIIEIE